MTIPPQNSEPDLVLDNPEVIVFIRGQAIDQINAKKIAILDIMESVADDIAEELRAWLKIANEGITDIENALFTHDVYFIRDDVLSQYNRIVVDNLTREGWITEGDSGWKLTNAPGDSGREKADDSGDIGTGTGLKDVEVEEPALWPLALVGLLFFL